MSIQAQALKTAHSIKTREDLQNKNWSAILSTAWKITNIKRIVTALIDFLSAYKLACARVAITDKLSTGAQVFAFKKVSGEVRNAIGTLETGYFKAYSFKGGDSGNPFYIRYYDTQKSGWRSFALVNFLGWS